MNEKQKELLQSQLNSEKKTLKELKQVYQQALNDCERKIRELSMRTDMENIQSIVYQKQYQQAIKGQLEGVLEQLHSNEFATVSDYLSKCYQDGYIGTMYDLAGQGIPLVIPMDQEQVVQAIQIDSKLSKPLYERLGEDVNKLKRTVRTEISRQIANGSTWNQVASAIALNFKNTSFNRAYNNAVRIARTEGHRVQVEAANNAQYKARDKGANIVKQWDASLDARTRPSHRRVDGEIRELDEKFSNGLKYPSDPSGGASEVVNCRCALLQDAKWNLGEEELDTLKERAAFFGLDKSENFDDYKKKYLQASESVRSGAQKIKPSEVSYEGYPKTWGELGKDADLMNVNISNSKVNCVNCTIAYEMRLRNKAVVAQASRIRALSNNPFAGWVNPEVIEVEPEKALSAISEYMSKFEGEPRCQIAVLWNDKKGIYSTSDSIQGHSIVGRMLNGKMEYIDIQNRKVYNDNEIKEVFEITSKVEFCRIDKLDINDLGASACRKE